MKPAGKGSSGRPLAFPLVVRDIVTCRDTRAEIQRYGCRCGAAARYEKALRQGEIVLSDTESVPGLHAWLDAEEAIERLCTIKERDRTHFIYLFPDLASLEVLADFSKMNLGALEQFLELAGGPVTCVFFGHDDPPSTVATRICSHPFLRPILRETHPVASTSANPHGAEAPSDLRSVGTAARSAADVEVRFPIPSTGVPSTVVEFTVNPPAIRRPGRLTEGQVRAALKAAGFGR